MQFEPSPGFDHNEPPVEAVIEYVEECIKKQGYETTDPHKIVIRFLLENDYSYTEIAQKSLAIGFRDYQANTLKNAYSKVQQWLQASWNVPRISKKSFKEVATQQYCRARAAATPVIEIPRILILTGPAGSGKTSLVRNQFDLLLTGGDQLQQLYLRAADVKTVAELYRVIQKSAAVNLSDRFDQSIRHGSTQADLPEPDLPPDRLDLAILRLLRQQKLVLILDQAEQLLDPNSCEIKPDSGYDKLLQAVARSDHGSCVVWVSNIKPTGLVQALSGAVHYEDHSGISHESAMALLAKHLSEEVLQRNPFQCQQLMALCSHNPSCLKAVGIAIRDIYNTSIQEFMADPWSLPNGLRSHLASFWEPLTPIEQSILYRLAFQPFGLAEIRHGSADVPYSQQELAHAWEKLCNRHLIDSNRQQITPPLLMHYVVNHLGDCLVEEFKTGNLNLLHRHSIACYRHPLSQQPQPYASLLKKLVDYCRKAYTRHPTDLVAKFEHLFQQLARFRNHYHSQALDSSYAAGNLINLAQALQLPWLSLPWDQLPLNFVNFQGEQLTELDLRNCCLRKASFASGLRDYIHASALNPDGSTLVLSDSTGQLQSYTYIPAEHRYQIQALKTLAQPPQNLQITEDQKLLLIDDQHRLLIVPSINQLDHFDTLDTEIIDTETISAHRFSLDPKNSLRVVVAYEDQIQIWDMPTSRQIESIEPMGEWVTEITVSPYADAIATRTDHQFLIWFRATGQSAYAAYTLALGSLSEGWLASQWTPTGFAVVEVPLDVMTEPGTASGHPLMPVYLHYFSLKDEYLVDRHLLEQDRMALPQQMGVPRLASFSENGEYLAIYSVEGSNHILQIWQLRSHLADPHSSPQTIPLRNNLTLPDGPGAILISNNGQRLLCQTSTTVTIWDINRNQCLQCWEVTKDPKRYQGYHFSSDHGLSPGEVSLLKSLGATVHESH